MLLKLVELRSSDWGRVRDAVAASNATPDNDPNYFMVRVGRAAAASRLCPLLITLCPLSQNEPTFYTEDGVPFTAADPGETQTESKVKAELGLPADPPAANTTAGIAPASGLVVGLECLFGIKIS